MIMGLMLSGCYDPKPRFDQCVNYCTFDKKETDEWISYCIDTCELNRKKNRFMFIYDSPSQETMLPNHTNHGK
jgi:hypothetical protein